MEFISPMEAMKRVADEIPAECRDNVIVVGSLAAAYYFFRDEEAQDVRTKDIDCLLSPRDQAITSGAAIARELVESGWKHRQEGEFCRPQSTPDPVDTLSAVRLLPPGSDDWFIELLSVPENEEDKGKKWIPIELDDGYYGLCSFEFLSLAAFDPEKTEFGIHCARPEMMALTNLLEHPIIGDEVMSSLYDGRAIKRSNKDLGRALALARLAGYAEVETWSEKWLAGLTSCFPSRWRELAVRVGSGLRRLIASAEDLEEALHTCNFSLLARQPLTLEEFRSTGERLIQDAVDPLESSVQED